MGKWSARNHAWSREGQRNWPEVAAMTAKRKRESDADMVVRLTNTLDAYREALQAAVPALSHFVEEYEPDTIAHQLCANALRQVRDALRQPAR